VNDTRIPPWADVRILVLDFDGVLTDGFVTVDRDGRESVRCSRRDGLGIRMLASRGIETMVISKETDPVVAARCGKLGIACRSGVDDKLPVLKAVLEEKGVDPRQACYVGDDVNDLDCVRFAGIGVAVADAAAPVLAAAAYVTRAKGGDHAVREVCDLILAALPPA
jgi:N-acylneuraminate cytidylyltransferase